MKIPREIILKYHEAYRESGVYLNRSIPYNTDLYLAEKHKAIASELFNSLNISTGKKEKQKLADFETLLANLLCQTRKPISVSLSKNQWVITRYNSSSYATVDMINTLSAQGLIKMKKGYHTEKESRLTRIEPTAKLLSYFPEYKDSVLMKPSQLVILRNESGRLIDYKETAKTWRIRDILSRVNEVNSKAEIRYGGYKLNAFLVAIFKERFDWYGRLHTRGFMHYQGFSGDERKMITINGDKIVELDYSALHPNLLYAAEGIQFTGDPYSIVVERPEARPFLKKILLCMINAKDKATAEAAARKWLNQHYTERNTLKKIGITKAGPLIDKFFEAHKPIAHHFCKGKETGMKIMNKDAQIAVDVVDHFAKKGVPILAIHDSFIVQKQYKAELFEVMSSTYHKHTHFTITIKQS